MDEGRCRQLHVPPTRQSVPGPAQAEPSPAFAGGRRPPDSGPCEAKLKSLGAPKLHLRSPRVRPSRGALRRTRAPIATRGVLGGIRLGLGVAVRPPERVLDRGKGLRRLESVLGNCFVKRHCRSCWDLPAGSDLHMSAPWDDADIDFRQPFQAGAFVPEWPVRLLVRHAQCAELSNVGRRRAKLTDFPKTTGNCRPCVTTRPMC